MIDPLARLPPEARRALRRSAQPAWIDPMRATLTDRRFSDPEWIYERKLDGVRCMVFRQGREVRMMSRNRLAVDAAYPELKEAFADQAGGEFVVDGEIVAFEGNQTSFARLQRRMKLRDPEQARRTGVRVFFYAFDVPHAAGYDLTGLELRHRKAVLRGLLGFEGGIRYTTHRNANGEAYWEQACSKGWEGVIAKRATSTYQQSRSGDWLKFKCVNEQEFVIGGFTDPKGSRQTLGALLIGHYRGDDLVYAGKVGTGFNDETLADLGKRLRSLERKDPPFARDVLPRLGVHWVQPELVAQIGFTEWTRDGQLRHPRFLGLRWDKPAREVIRERPVRSAH
jgi:bifunctional non-homologous end joining protein LigD